MPRFLVVDDDPGDREWISEALSHPGTSVHACQNGTEAIEFYRRERADLVFCDLKMPGIDGWSVLDAMKGIDPWATVVMVTGHSSVEAATHSLRLGAYDFVEKPFTFSQIQQVATRALDHRKQLKEVTLVQGKPGTASDLPARLEQMEQMKADFFNLIIQELRIPLRLLNETLALIQNGFYQAPWLKQFMTSLNRIQMLLSRTLAGSLAIFLGNEQRIESDRVDLRRIVADPLQKAISRCQEKGIAFVPKLPPCALIGSIDPEKVVSIVNELLDSAIHAAPAGGTVTFQLMQTAEGFRLQISDTGHSRLSGLGLVLIRHYLDLLRGTLSMTSSPDKGSRFVVNLPWWEKP